MDLLMFVFENAVVHFLDVGIWGLLGYSIFRGKRTLTIAGGLTALMTISYIGSFMAPGGPPQGVMTGMAFGAISFTIFATIGWLTKKKADATDTKDKF